MKKYIRIETGSYRGTDQSGRVLPIVKDFQSFSNKPGGFVTCAVSELPGYEGLDKVRINVPSLTSFQIVAEGEYIKFRDLKLDMKDGVGYFRHIYNFLFVCTVVH